MDFQKSTLRQFNKELSETPIHNIFRFILIIFASSASQFLPFKLNLIDDPILLYIVGFFSLTIFVVMFQNKEKNSADIVKLSLTLYILFLLMTLTPKFIFFSLFFILFLMYLIDIRKRNTPDAGQQKLFQNYFILASDFFFITLSLGLVIRAFTIFNKDILG